MHDLERIIDPLVGVGNKMEIITCAIRESESVFSNDRIAEIKKELHGLPGDSGIHPDK